MTYSHQIDFRVCSCSVRGGGIRLDREIRGVRILHTPDMARFMQGGEVLLTSLQAYENAEEREVRQHLQEICDKKVCAFIVKRNTKTKQQRYLKILLQIAEAQQVPVIEIPEDSYFSEITKYVLVQIFDRETAKLAFFKMAHASMSYIALHGGDVRSTIRCMIQQMKFILGNPVALYDAEFNCQVSSEEQSVPFALAKDRTEFVTDVLTQYTFYRQKRDCVEFIKKIVISGRWEVYLVIFESENPMNELDFIALETMVVSLEYTIARAVIEMDIAKKYHGDIIYRLMTGVLSAEEENEAAEMLHLQDADEMRVVTFRMMPTNLTSRFAKEIINETELEKKAIAKLLPKGYILAFTNQVIYIHKKDEKESDRDFRSRIEDVQCHVQQRLVQRKLKLECLVGIGKSVCGYHRLKESFEDSKTAIRYISIIRTIVGDQNKSVVDCPELGFFRMFVETQDRAKLETFIPESLNQLEAYDCKKNGELIKTLECYLNNKQSIKVTSKKMFAHYRTISYRLEKIVDLTGMDFNNPTEMLAVRNGLIIYRILKTM